MTQKIVVGGIYSVSNGENKDYGIVKVIAEDSIGVHVRSFSNKFSTRPKTINLSDLSLGKIGDKNPGIEHLPILKKVFQSWSPIFITKEPVKEDELVGYKEWLSAKGGYWGNE